MRLLRETLLTCCLSFSQLAHQRGLITLEERERVFKVMQDLGLALWDDVCDDHNMLWKVSHCSLYFQRRACQHLHMACSAVQC